MTSGVTNESSGVDYSVMDPHKVESIMAAAATDVHLEKFGFKALEWTRGESVFLVETPLGYIGLVVEGLGTKNLVADALYELAQTMENLSGNLPHDHSYYDRVGICNAAMAFNDVITLGARPFLYGQYLATGSSDWFKDQTRRRDLIRGTQLACNRARCTWGGGETPTLGQIIFPAASDLAGATVGIISDKKQLINPERIRSRDAIVFLESSGIHANGLSAARKIAQKLSPDPMQRPELGYLEKLSNGQMFGEALLTPTHIYVEFVCGCLDAGVELHYTVNVTGHGWRKLMRANGKFIYVIHTLPTQQPVFGFMQKYGGTSDYDAYGMWNMGAGFAVYCPKSDVGKVIEIAAICGFRAFEAGEITESQGEKKVLIGPVGLEYGAETLQVR